MTSRAERCLKACDGIPDEILERLDMDNLLFQFIDAVERLEAVCEVDCTCEEIHGDFITCPSCDIRNLYLGLKPLTDKYLSNLIGE